MVNFSTIPLETLAAIRMTALTLAGTGCPGVCAVISAIVLTAFGHAFPLLYFAVATRVGAILVSHSSHLLSDNFRFG